jgi:hypothetical protein
VAATGLRTGELTPESDRPRATWLARFGAPTRRRQPVASPRGHLDHVDHATGRSVTPFGGCAPYLELVVCSGPGGCRGRRL